MIFSSTLPGIVRRRARRLATDIRRNPPSRASRLRTAPTRRARGGVPSGSSKAGARRGSASRRIVVLIVPPVDELDLVGPLQVFNSVNRLAGRAIYAIEVVTSTDRLTAESESGVLTFIARH